MKTVRNQLLDNLSDANKNLNKFLEARDEIIKNVVQKMCDLGFASGYVARGLDREPMQEVLARRVCKHINEAFSDIEKSLRFKIRIEVGDLIRRESENLDNEIVFEAAFRNIERAKQGRDKESS